MMSVNTNVAELSLDQGSKPIKLAVGFFKVSNYLYNIQLITQQLVEGMG